MRRLITGLVVTGLLVVSLAAPAFAAKPVGTGTLWLDGEQVRTLVPPAATTKPGRDALYMVEGTGGVAAVGPGDKDYHGGHWAAYEVAFDRGASPYPLTSEAAVLAAEAAGVVTITRRPGLDFRCPIQP